MPVGLGEGVDWPGPGVGWLGLDVPSVAVAVAVTVARLLGDAADMEFGCSEK